MMTADVAPNKCQAISNHNADSALLYKHTYYITATEENIFERGWEFQWLVGFFDIH